MAKLDMNMIILTTLLFLLTTTTAQPETALVSKECGPPSMSPDRDAVLNELGSFNGAPSSSVGSGSMRGVTQCMRDLSVDQCRNCVFQAVNLLRTDCGSAASGDVFLAKCYARFTDTVTVSGSGLGLGSGSDMDSGDDDDGKFMLGSLQLNSPLFIAAALALLVVILILVFIFVQRLLRKRKHKGGAGGAIAATPAAGGASAATKV